MWQSLRYLLLSLLCVAAFLPAPAQEALQISDLTLDTIDRAMTRESSRGAKLVKLLDHQKAEADAKLDALEKRYQELRLAVYYQDYNNFFYLTYFCRSIAELRRECTSGSFPFSQTITRMEMAIQRYTYLRQALEDLQKNTAHNEEETALLTRALNNCTALEKDYRRLYDGLMDEQRRFDDLTARIRTLDIYANGHAVEIYNAINSEHTGASMRKALEKFAKVPGTPAAESTAESPKDGEAAPAKQNDGGADTEQKRALHRMLAEQAEENAKAYGSLGEISGDVALSDEQQTEGRLATRIAMALWDPSHPDRQISVNADNFLRILGYIGMAFTNQYLDPYDVVFAGSVRAVAVALIASILLSVLLCAVVYKISRRGRKHRYSKERTRAAMVPLACFLCAFFMWLFSMQQHLGYMANHTHALAIYLVLAGILFGSLTVRLSSRRVISGIRLFIPFFVLNLLIVIYCVMMCGSFLVSMTVPLVFLLCGIWMTTRFIRRMSRLRISARVFAVLSMIIMFVGAWMCWRGYYYVMMLSELCWFVFVTNTMLMTAISKLGKLLCRRIHANRKLQGYRHYLCMWVQLIIMQMVLPLLFLGLIWYGLRWPADAFDLSQFLASWMGTPHHLSGAIRSISADRLVLIITVGIGTNCLVQVTRRTLDLIYGKKAEAGRSQTIVTIGSMVVWGAFAIFALNALNADYSSILVVMGGMSVGVGLGMKDTIDNLISGLSLMLGRMRPGDVVECDGVRGNVANIGYRTTTLETVDGSVICFQNSQLFTQNFRNMTRNHQYERCVVSIGVTYGTDVARTRRLILKALHRLPGLSTQHPTAVLLDNFGDSSVDLSVVVWVPVATKVATLSRVREIVYNTFNENNIEIPFPQQDLHIIAPAAATDVQHPFQEETKAAK